MNEGEAFIRFPILYTSLILFKVFIVFSETCNWRAACYFLLWKPARHLISCGWLLYRGIYMLFEIDLIYSCHLTMCNFTDMYFSKKYVFHSYHWHLIIYTKLYRLHQNMFVQFTKPKICIQVKFHNMQKLYYIICGSNWRLIIVWPHIVAMELMWSC